MALSHAVGAPGGREERPDSFWRSFAQEKWEKEPFSAPPGTVTPPDASEMFRQLVRWCASARAGGWDLVRRDAVAAVLGRHRPFQAGEPVIRFIVEGADLLRKPRLVIERVVLPGYLPQPDDGSFEGYHARVDALLNPPWRRRLGLRPRRYGLAINFAEHGDFAFWRWSRDFLRPLHRAIGMSNAGTYNAVFVGNYTRTAVGVHVDQESVFSVPVVGRKAIRTWHPDYVEKHPELMGANDYAEQLGASTLTTAEPGGFIYWPSKLWHVGESDGTELSVAIAVSCLCFPDGDFAMGPPSFDALQKHVWSDAPKTVPFDPDDVQASVARVPPDLKLAAPVRSQRDVQKLWLKMATGAGYAYAPHFADAPPLPAAGQLRRVPDAALVWVEDGPEKLLVASNGSVLEAARTDAVVEALGRLRRGATIDVRAFEAEPPVGKLMTELLRVRCVEAV